MLHIDFIDELVYTLIFYFIRLFMIYYWKGAEGSEGLLEDHKEAIKDLLSGNYNASDLEKFKHASAHTIYSYRLNREARLLFTTHKGLLHVLEFIPNHDYQKSLFLKSGVLRNYLSKYEKSKEAIFDQLSDADPKPKFSGDMDSKTGFDYYNQQFITLSKGQARVVQDKPLPLILHGAAGSGKSYVGFSILQEKLTAVSDAPPRCLYITKESSLVSSMSSNWDTYFSPGLETEGTLEFKTYDALLADFGLESSLAASHLFTRWFSSLKLNDAIPLHSSDALYQEFRICSGLSQSEYERLGERQSSIPQGTGRRELYACYQRYLRSLGSQIDSVVSPCLEHEEPCYDLIVVDETHRFSLLQNLTLFRLARNHAIVYCLDAHQNLEDCCPTRGLLEVQLRTASISSIMLEQTYRCTKRVNTALDSILENNRRILGGKFDKAEALSMSSTQDIAEGEFLQLLPAEVQKQAWLFDRANGVHLAVVTQPDYVDEARTLFNTELVFTPKQIQGQEFHTLVVYKLLCDPNSKRILKLTSDALSREPQHATVHRSKNKTSCPYAPWTHEIFTACSRAKHSLVIVDERNPYWDGLTPSAPSSFIEPMLALPTSQEDWIAMAVKQATLNNQDIATRIKAVKLDSDALMKSPEPASAKKASSPNKKKSPPKPVPASKIDESTSQPQFNDDLGEKLIKMIKQNKKMKHIQPLIDDFSVNLNQVSSFGHTPLIDAVYSENVILVQALIATGARIDLNLAVTSEGMTALLVAAMEGIVKIVHVLISAGARIDLNHAALSVGTTPLIFATVEGYLEIVQALITAGADLNKVDLMGNTALFVAAEGGHLEILQALIAAEVELNKANLQGVTALMAAIKNGHVHVVNALIAAGTDLKRTNMRGKTALDYVMQGLTKNPSLLDHFLSHACVLHDILTREYRDTESILKHQPILLVKLIQQRESCWSILNSAEALGITSDAHRTLLANIIGADKPDARLFHLHEVLFKKIRVKNADLFFLSPAFTDVIKKSIAETIRQDQEEGGVILTV